MKTVNALVLTILFFYPSHKVFGSFFAQNFVAEMIETLVFEYRKVKKKIKCSFLLNFDA